MATSYILDASIAVKWFFREKELHFREAQKVFQDIQSGKIEVVTIDFLLVELTNVFIVSKKANYLTAINSCKILLKSKIKFVPFSINLLFSATRLAEKYNITIYDSLYLALALEKNCRLITADKILSNLNQHSLFIADFK